jgi:flagellar basal body rod protein FlgG
MAKREPWHTIRFAFSVIRFVVSRALPVIIAFLLCGSAHGLTVLPIRIPIPNFLLPRPVELRYTGYFLDLAINGPGYFLVKDPRTGELFVTRYGVFRLDSEGRVVNTQGFRLQGFNTPILLNETYAESTALADLQLDKGLIPANLPITAANSQVMDIYIAGNGRLIIFLADGTAYVRGQIVLQDFEKPSLLRTRWLYLFDNLEPALKKTSRQGIVVSGALEANFPNKPGLLLDRAGQTATVWDTGSNGRILQASTDLVHWTSVVTNRTQFFADGSSGRPAIFFSDTNATTSVRFYRIVAGPAIYLTGVATDLAIEGEGFFIVKNATGESFATRAGHFEIDRNGFLITEQSLRVQGFSEVEPPGGYKAASVIGDIKLDKGSTLPAGALAESFNKAEISNILIDASGKINVLLSDGTQYVRGQILLQDFSNPFALVEKPNGLLGNIAQAGPFPTLTPPNTKNLGRIESGALEIPALNK